jgi:hypothetical protein
MLLGVILSEYMHHSTIHHGNPQDAVFYELKRRVTGQADFKKQVADWFFLWHVRSSGRALTE